MIKKTVILGLIVCSFLVSSTIPVVAAEGVIDDELDDVYDAAGDFTSDTPNLDIDKVTYKREGQAVTLKLSVNEKGVIEDKGTLEAFKFLLLDEEGLQEMDERLSEMTPEELEEFTNMILNPYICYWFMLKTKKNEYNISYVNEEYIIKDLYSTGEVQGDVDVDGNELTISFDLIDSGDRLVNLTVAAMELIELVAPVYSDDASIDCIDAAASGGSSGSSDTPGFEMITVIAALAIAFIVLRRKKQ